MIMANGSASACQLCTAPIMRLPTDVAALSCVVAFFPLFLVVLPLALIYFMVVAWYDLVRVF